MRAVCGRRRRKKESHWNQKYMFITCRLSFMVSSSRVVKKKWNWSSTKMYRHLIRSHDVKPRAGFDRQQPKWIENNKNTTKSTLMLIGPFNSRFSFCVANSLPSSLRFVHFLHIIPINYVYDDEKNQSRISAICIQYIGAYACANAYACMRCSYCKYIRCWGMTVVNMISWPKLIRSDPFWCVSS